MPSSTTLPSRRRSPKPSTARSRRSSASCSRPISFPGVPVTHSWRVSPSSFTPKGKKIVTELKEAGQWYDAEDVRPPSLRDRTARTQLIDESALRFQYHQLYLDNNPSGYTCPTQSVSPLLARYRGPHTERRLFALPKPSLLVDINNSLILMRSALSMPPASFVFDNLSRCSSLRQDQRLFDFLLANQSWATTEYGSIEEVVN